MKLLAESSSFLVLQEHWLFSFETQDIFKYLPDYDGHLTATDINDPISSVQRPRGYGGVAIIWNRLLSPMVTKLSVTTARIIAVSIKGLAERETCLLGEYFPCRGSEGGESEFDQTLSQLVEICSNYVNTHCLIIAADFNTDLLKASPRTNKVHAALKDFHLSLFDCPVAQTFQHHNDLGGSQIDFILESQQLDLSMNSIGLEPLNTSTHLPINASIISSYSPTQASSPPLEQRPPRLQWDKLNLLVYKDHIFRTLDTTTPVSSNNTDIDRATTHIITVLSKAASGSVPARRPGHGTQSTKTCGHPQSQPP